MWQIGNNQIKSESKPLQFSTFLVADQLYGIEVKCVQEVVKAMPLTKIPLAPRHMVGLINLRGQVVTAIGMRELFELPDLEQAKMMNVVCRAENILLSLLVDEIGDVVEVEPSSYETTPANVSSSAQRFLGGIYTNSTQILSVVALAPICNFLGLKNKRN